MNAHATIGHNGGPPIIDATTIKPQAGPQTALAVHVGVCAGDPRAKLVCPHVHLRRVAGHARRRAIVVRIPPAAVDPVYRVGRDPHPEVGMRTVRRRLAAVGARRGYKSRVRFWSKVEKNAARTGVQAMLFEQSLKVSLFWRSSSRTAAARSNRLGLRELLSRPYQQIATVAGRFPHHVAPFIPFAGRLGHNQLSGSIASEVTAGKLSSKSVSHASHR